MMTTHNSMIFSPEPFCCPTITRDFEIIISRQSVKVFWKRLSWSRKQAVRDGVYL